MKNLLCLLLTVTLFSCSKDSRKLGKLFPVDDIESVAVSNFTGMRRMTPAELEKFKTLLKDAHYAGGTMNKAGASMLFINMKKGSECHPGYIFAQTGRVYFENCVGKGGVRFAGSFDLGEKLNFEEFR